MLPGLKNYWAITDSSSPLLSQHHHCQPQPGPADPTALGWLHFQGLQAFKLLLALTSHWPGKPVLLISTISPSFQPTSLQCWTECLPRTASPSGPECEESLGHQSQRIPQRYTSILLFLQFAVVKQKLYRFYLSQKKKIPPS